MVRFLHTYAFELCRMGSIIYNDNLIDAKKALMKLVIAKGLIEEKNRFVVILEALYEFHEFDEASEDLVVEESRVYDALMDLAELFKNKIE